MAYAIVITQRAANEIRQTIDYIASNAPSSATTWGINIKAAIKSLEESPLRSPAIPENNRFKADYRHLIHKSHRIIFRVDEAKHRVIIVRVYHTSRRPLRSKDLP